MSALIFADDRPTSCDDDLYQWAMDAEAMIRNLHTENTALRVTEDNLRQELQECQDQRRAAFRRIEELDAMRAQIGQGVPEGWLLIATDAYEAGYGNGLNAKQTGRETENPWADEPGRGAWAIGYELAKERASTHPAPQTDRSGCTAGTDEECKHRHCATQCPKRAQIGQGVPEVSTEHGPWVLSTIHEGETYCERCLLRSAFVGARECKPHIKESTYPAPQQIGQCDMQIRVLFECVENGVTGTTSAPVKRVEWEDDGTLTAVLDYWPPPAPQQKPLTDEQIDRLLPEIVNGGFTVITYGRAVARAIEAAHNIGEKK